MFTYVTEFCRHFYSLLDRAGSGNAANLEKIDKIVKRLQDYEQQLSSRKNQMLEKERNDVGGKFCIEVHKEKV